MAAVTVVHDCDIEMLDSPTALGGVFRNCKLSDEYPTYNYYGDLAAGKQASGKGSFHFHALVRFDLNRFIPADATITAAVWHVYYYTSVGGPDPHTYHVRRCVRTDWVEDEATWNVYKTGSNWAQSGGELADPTITLGNIEGSGWQTFTITDMATDAWANRSGICTFILRRYDINNDTGYIGIYSKQDRPLDAEHIHHLRITYTLDGKRHEALIR